jgi:hypothetical protein
MAAQISLSPCPHCGGRVSASYCGSSDWEIFHVDENGDAKEQDAECVSVTIYARASSAEWDADDNAEWNIMALKWNRRISPPPQ